jgi:hypothetical protein
MVLLFERRLSSRDSGMELRVCDETAFFGSLGCCAVFDELLLMIPL